MREECDGKEGKKAACGKVRRKMWIKKRKRKREEDKCVGEGFKKLPIR